MAKLPTPTKAGFNAGDSYNVKYIRIDKIVIDQEIAGIFEISVTIKDEIKQSILKNGFFKEEPISIWKTSIGEFILVDGRTRYTAAKEAGETEIPFIEKQFESREDAILYTFERQVLRRNLTNSEILSAAKMLPDKKAKNGEGRAAEIWAKRLKISADLIYKADRINKEGSEELIKEVKENKKTVTKAYKEIVNSKKEKPEEKHDAPQRFSSKVSFLKTSVILLIESDQIPATELLINHFLKKNEKSGFYELLPEAIKAKLPRLPLVVQPTN